MESQNSLLNNDYNSDNSTLIKKMYKVLNDYYLSIYNGSSDEGIGTEGEEKLTYLESLQVRWRTYGKGEIIITTLGVGSISFFLLALVIYVGYTIKKKSYDGRDWTLVGKSKFERKNDETSDNMIDSRQLLDRDYRTQVKDFDMFSSLFHSPFEFVSKSKGGQDKVQRSRGGKEEENKAFKNVITPDRRITFVVPTISLNVQDSAIAQGMREELKERVNSPLVSPLTQECHYPQLERLEGCNPHIGFNLFYESSTQILFVRLLGGQNFPTNDPHYVSVKVYPGRYSKNCSSVYTDSFPVYNQEFGFHVRKAVLLTKILKIKVVLATSPKSLLGCINLALKDVQGFRESAESGVETKDLKSPQLWKRLNLSTDSTQDGIKLHVSLKWNPDPDPGLLTLKIFDVTGLHDGADNDYSSTYVKVTLQEQGQDIKSKKTRLIRWGSLPLYDDVFVVTISKDLLTYISFELSLIARGRLGYKATLGKIIIGPVPYSSSAGGSEGSGSAIWDDMTHQAGHEVHRWLSLTN